MSGNAVMSIPDILREIADLHVRYDTLQELLDAHDPTLVYQHRLQQLPAAGAEQHQLNQQYQLEQLHEQLRVAQLACAKDKKDLADAAVDKKALQRTVGILHQQLSRYVRCSVQELPPSPSYETTWSPPRQDLRKLVALVAAYDELVAENKDVIRNWKHEYEHFVKRLADVTNENDKLHERLRILKEEMPIGSEDARAVTHNAGILMRERDVLLEETSILRLKLQKAQHDSKKRLDDLDQQLLDACCRNKSLESEIESQREEVRKKTSLCAGLEAKLNRFISPEACSDMRDDWERNEETMRKQFDLAQENCKIRVAELQQQKRALERDTTAALDEAQEARMKCDSLKEELRKQKKQEKKLEHNLKKAETTNQAFKKELEKVSKLCDQLTRERSQLLQARSDLTSVQRELQDETTRTAAQIGQLQQRLHQTELKWKKTAARAAGEISQVKKALKESERELRRMSEHERKRDREMKALEDELRFLGLDVRPRHCD